MTKSERFNKALLYVTEQLINWAYKDRICAIYLYGSFARNEHRADSDIDIYIQMDKDTDPCIIRQLKTLCNPDDYTLPEVDVKIDKGMDRLQEEDLFHQNIRREGILLWKRE